MANSECKLTEYISEQVTKRCMICGYFLLLVLIPLTSSPLKHYPFINTSCKSYVLSLSFHPFCSPFMGLFIQSFQPWCYIIYFAFVWLFLPFQLFPNIILHCLQCPFCDYLPFFIRSKHCFTFFIVPVALLSPYFLNNISKQCFTLQCPFLLLPPFFIHSKHCLRSLQYPFCYYLPLFHLLQTLF